MRRYLFVLLSVAFLAAGCASVSAPHTSPSSGDQEQKIRELFKGTWTGYIVNDNPWYSLTYLDVKLQIFEIRKEKGGWVVNATINWQSPEYIELYVYNGRIELKIMDLYGGFFTLTPYGDNHLVGGVSYGRGRWHAYSLSLKRVR